MNTGQDFSISQWLQSRTGLVFLAILGIITFFLVTEHTAHFFGVLPNALLLLCPLLHLLLHGRHGDHNAHTDHGGHAEGKDRPSPGGLS
jgi:DUF2933 family protein